MAIKPVGILAGGGDVLALMSVKSAVCCGNRIDSEEDRLGVARRSL